jgi:phosphoglycerate dehydrogenase-like enzyme
MNKDEVAITPHIAFFTKEAKTEILNTTVENIISFMNNNPINTVK